MTAVLTCVGVWVLVAILLSLILGTYLAALFDPGERETGLRCRVSTESTGLFIGRRWCSAHEVKWDNGGPCPNAGTLTVGRRVQP